jgi:soluble lytic murein transglycosylase-like protein
MANGERLHITGFEKIGSTVRLHVSGGTVDVPAGEVARFEPEEVYEPIAATQKSAPLTVPYSDLIRAAAKKYDLDEHLLAGVMRAESNFNPRAVSAKNAQGLMQLLPSTASRLAVRDTFDPAQSVEAGAHYLKQLLDRFSGNVALALAAYNAGPKRVVQYNGVPPYRETQNYVKRVTKGLAVNASPATPAELQALLLTLSKPQ